MRQVFIQVPRGQDAAAKEIIERYDPMNMVQLQAEDAEGPTEVFITSVSNGKIEGLFEDLNSIQDTQVTLVPQGVFAFDLDTPQIAQQVINIDLLSPVEVFLNGLQSIGTWKGFLGYAAAAGVLVWLGLYMNSVVLLIAGMLVSPLASPAMNVAIALARGDMELLQHGLMRYVAAIMMAILVAAGLTAALDLDLITRQMDKMGSVSELAVLTPLVVGAGGALSLVQSRSSSLVSGTVSGLLVAASLAPPVALIGIGAVMGEWDLVHSAGFIVLLQLVGINLAGSVLLRLTGLKVEDSRYKRGKRWLFPVGLTVTLIALAGLLVWQHAEEPELQRTSLAQRAAMDIRRVVSDDARVSLVELETRFTRTEIEGQNTLFAQVYVQPRGGVELADSVLSADLRHAIQTDLVATYELTPLVNITVLNPP